MAKPVPARTEEEAVANILRFERELKKSPDLRDRLSHVHAWYAFRAPNRDWAFGPSKFVGYRENTAQQYLRAAKGAADGRRSEAALGQWFETVDPASRLSAELDDALRQFLARWDRAPRRTLRINVLKSELDAMPARAAVGNDRLLSRISSDPCICGGRPCIKGTRMRVSDVVDMLAHGATRAEILKDFPYLSKEDIAAALAYAARSTDHRVIRAA